MERGNKRFPYEGFSGTANVVQPSMTGFKQIRDSTNFFRAASCAFVDRVFAPLKAIHEITRKITKLIAPFLIHPHPETRLTHPRTRLTGVQLFSSHLH